MSFLTKGVLHGVGNGVLRAGHNVSCFLHKGPSGANDMDLVTLYGNTIGQTFNVNGIAVVTTAGTVNGTLKHLDRYPLKQGAILSTTWGDYLYGWVDKIRETAESFSAGTTAGYFYKGSINTYNCVDRLDYSAEVVTQVSSWLGQHTFSAGLSNATNNAGYAFGGYDWFGVAASLGSVSSIRKYNFSDNTHASLSGQNLTAVTKGAASFYDTTRGHIVGGGDASDVPRTQIDKFVFSTEVCSASGQTLGTALRYSSGWQSSTNGYNAGGQTSTPTAVNTITRIPHATSTPTGASNNLATNRTQCSTGNSSSTKSFVVGGGSDTGGTLATSMEKFTHSSETTAVSAQDLNYGALYYAPSNSVGADSASNGYLAINGGQLSSAITYSAAVFKIDFTTEVLTVLATNLYGTPDGNSVPGSRFASFTKTA